VGIALIALLVAGCSDIGAARPVTIANLTSGPVEVTVHETSSDGLDHPGAVETIPPGASQGFNGPLLHSCMTGTFVVIQDGRTVATIEKPCEGSHWEISTNGATQTS
jgi:hypothetical protein